MGSNGEQKQSVKFYVFCLGRYTTRCLSHVMLCLWEGKVSFSIFHGHTHIPAHKEHNSCFPSLYMLLLLLYEYLLLSQELWSIYFCIVANQCRHLSSVSDKGMLPIWRCWNLGSSARKANVLPLSYGISPSCLIQTEIIMQLIRTV